MRASHAIAVSMPPPNARPLSAATVGFLTACTASTHFCDVREVCSPIATLSILARKLTSAPLTNAFLPKPVSTMPFTLGSASHCWKRVASSWNTDWSRALSTLGRRIVSTATPSRSSRSTTGTSNGLLARPCSATHFGTGKPACFLLYASTSASAFAVPSSFMNVNAGFMSSAMSRPMLKSAIDTRPASTISPQMPKYAPSSSSRMRAASSSGTSTTSPRAATSQLAFCATLSLSDCGVRYHALILLV